MILKAAVLLIYLGPLSLVIFASSLTSTLGQSGCGPGTTLVPATNECVPATVKCGAGTILNAATNQCDLATASQTTQPNATASNATAAPQATQPNATASNATASNATASNATASNATAAPQATQTNATNTEQVSNATAGTTVTTGGASKQCKGDEVGLGNLCIPRSCTALLNSFAMNLRDLTQEQIYKQCAEEGLISK